jgi:hypothetical protein
MFSKPEVTVGTRIWRPISAHVHGPLLDKVEYERTERGQYLFKADAGRGHFTKEWVAFSATCRFGLVCFIDEPPTGPWTYFEVMRISRNGKSVHVQAVNGDPKELYAQYEDIGIRNDLPLMAA